MSSSNFWFRIRIKLELELKLSCRKDSASLGLTDYFKTAQHIPLRVTGVPVSYKCMTAVQISVGGEVSRLSCGSGSSARPSGLLELKHKDYGIQRYTHAHIHSGDKELLKGT